MKLQPMRIAKLLVLAGLAIPASSVRAQVSLGPTPCASSTLTQFNPDAVACFGAAIGPNGVPSFPSILTSQFLAYVGAGGWTYEGTTNAGQASGPFAYVPATFSGVMLFDSPLSGIFAIALQSSTHFSIYLFNSAVNVAGIDFTTIGTSLVKQGIANTISQASLYTYKPAGGPPIPVTSTPEPGTMLLAASGLASLGGYMRRRRRA
jgi:hypothetical protein